MPDDKELNELIEQNKEVLKEMFEFWHTIQSLNKFLKWLVYIGAPLAIGLWSIYKFIKDRQ